LKFTSQRENIDVSEFNFVKYADQVEHLEYFRYMYAFGDNAKE